MDPTQAELSRTVPASWLLGWMNLSDGRPDPKWQRQLDDAYDHLVSQKGGQSWMVLVSWLRSELNHLQTSGSPAFQDTAQARAVLSLVFDHALPTYPEFRLFQRLRRQPVGPHAPCLAGAHQAASLEHREVLGERRQRHLERPSKLGDRRGTPAQALQHLAPGRVGESVKDAAQLLRIVRHLP